VNAVAGTDSLNTVIETVSALLVQNIFSMPLPIFGSKWTLNCNNEGPLGHLEF